MKEITARVIKTAAVVLRESVAAGVWVFIGLPESMALPVPREG